MRRLPTHRLGGILTRQVVGMIYPARKTWANGIHPTPVTQRTYKLAALFFFILGVTCIIGAVAMFRSENPDCWFCLAIGVTGLFAAGAIRMGASRKT